MRLSRIYSNIEREFHTIDFHRGLNVILGEINDPDKIKTDAHNLGKTKLSQLIDFCLLKGRSRKFFLFQFYHIFERFEFYLEVELNGGDFLTIKRSVEKNTRIYLKKHKHGKLLLRGLDDDAWDHAGIQIDQAKLLLDSYFDLDVIGGWGYRDAVAYCLRAQEDYSDIFQLDKFRGSHLYWKPYLGHVLGFNSDLLKKNYLLRNELDGLQAKLGEIKKAIGAHNEDQEEILNGILKAKSSQAENLNWQLSNFNFDDSDAQLIEQLVNEIDDQLTELTKLRYYLTARVKKLRRSYEAGEGRLDVGRVAKLFEEAGVVFGGQIKKSYEDLVVFNRKITEERRGIIFQQIEEIEAELDDVVEQVEHLHSEKSRRVSFLNEMDIFPKYKEVARLLAEVNYSIAEVNKKIEINNSIKLLEEERRSLLRQKEAVVGGIRENRENVMHEEGGPYISIKEIFVNYVSDVLGKNGILKTEQNEEGNLEYSAGILDGNGGVTGESDGHSYKKILCIGFDLAVLIAYSRKKFVRFLYHDGGLETLDDRKKVEFIEYIRTASSIYGFQYILTLIDSDLPKGLSFTAHEITRVLHDGENGRLFNIPSW